MLGQLGAATRMRGSVPPGEALPSVRIWEGHTKLGAGTGPSPAFGVSSTETGENLILPVLPELGIGSQDLPLEASGDLVKRGMQKQLAQLELWTSAGLDSWLALSSVQGQAKRTCTSRLGEGPVEQTG